MVSSIQQTLEFYAKKYNNKNFIETDPISIPHSFSKRQDIEISAFWTATIAWGNRKSIIQNGRRLMQLMDNSPHDFVVHHQESDRKNFEKFVHRTFQYTDTLYFLEFFQNYYIHNNSLEDAFVLTSTGGETPYFEMAFNQFHQRFFNLENVPARTLKHVSKPSSGSRCKRLVMFLRWMVRKDNKGVDFGLWKNIKMSQLMIPLDVHVERSARSLGLLKRSSLDWKAVVELSDNCRRIRPDDPSYYDFALFGMSIEKLF
ncbi:MAG: TIGR02757 family protein [Saprospiraceae bacterium]|nr:TIGR02757 family protein [Saprospiraceae bacterium]